MVTPLHPCETVELVTLADFDSVPECGDIGQVVVGSGDQQHWVCFRHAQVFGITIVCSVCAGVLQPSDASPTGWAHNRFSNHPGEPSIGTPVGEEPNESPAEGFCTVTKDSQPAAGAST